MKIEQKRVIALGFFDGVHLGHQALLRRTVERAAEQGMIPAVFTFDRAPKAVVTGRPVPLLTTPEERIALVHRLFSIEEVIVAPFDQAMMTMPWEAYISMLVERFRAGWLVAGHDFRFGHRNSGDPQRLQQRCRALGLGCDIIPAVTLAGRTVSSTYIRQLLAAGQRQEAERFLGHPLPESLSDSLPPPEQGG